MSNNISIQNLIGVHLDTKHPFITEEGSNERLSLIQRIKKIEEQLDLFNMLMVKLRREPGNVQNFSDKTKLACHMKANELFKRAAAKSMELAEQNIHLAIDYQKHLADLLDKHAQEVLLQLKINCSKTLSKQSRYTRESSALLPKAYEIFSSKEVEAPISLSSSDEDPIEQPASPLSPRLTLPRIISTPKLKNEEAEIVRKIKKLTRLGLDYAFSLAVSSVNKTTPRYSHKDDVDKRERQLIEKHYKSMRLPLLAEEKMARSLKDTQSSDLNANGIGLDIHRQLLYITLKGQQEKTLGFDSYLEQADEREQFVAKCEDFSKLLFEFSEHLSKDSAPKILAVWVQIINDAKKGDVNENTFAECCVAFLKNAETKWKSDLLWSSLRNLLQSITQNTYLVPLGAVRSIFPEPKTDTKLATGAKIHYELNQLDGTITLTSERSLWLFPAWEFTADGEETITASLGKITVVNVLTSTIRDLPNWTSTALFTLEEDSAAEAKTVENKILKPLKSAGFF